MKDELSLVPWDRLQGQTANCGNVPKALEALSSRRKSNIAADWLDNHIICQGAVYEGAFFALPFLLQLCHQGNVEALELVIEIACGRSDFNETVRFETVTRSFQFFVPCEMDHQIKST